MIRNRTTTISQPAMGRAIGAAAALMMLAGTTPETLAETEVSAGEVSDDNRCITFTVTRDDETDTPVRDLHFAKGSLPENFDDLTVTVKSGDEELDGWVVDVRNGKVNVYAPDGEVPVGDVTIKLTIPDAAAGEKQHEWGTKNSAKTKLYTTEDGDHLTSNDQTNDTLTDHGKNARLPATEASVAPTNPGDQLLSASADPRLIEEGVGLACFYPGIDPPTTAPTSWWRSFDLRAMDVSGTFVVTEAIIPIELASHPEGSQAATVRLYLDPTGGDINPDELELLAAAGIGVANTLRSTISITIPARVPAGGTLVMEVESDDGSSPAAPGTLFGGQLILGGNTLPQISPSYMSGRQCDLGAPVDVRTLGSELSLGMHVLGYEELGCYADLDGDGSLTIFDFLAFQNLFVAGDPLADCDGSGELNIFDFLCFQNAFAAGCPGPSMAIDRVRPRTVEPGTELTVVGSGFGESLENLRVTVGADEAGRGGVLAEVLRASPDELLVRMPDRFVTPQGSGVLVSLGEAFDPAPHVSPVLSDMAQQAFRIRDSALGGVALAILGGVEESTETTKTGEPQCWHIDGLALEGDTQCITVVITRADGSKTTHTRTGTYKDDITLPDAIGEDLADWLDGIDGIDAKFLRDTFFYRNKLEIEASDPDITSISVTITTTGGNHTIE